MLADSSYPAISAQHCVSAYAPDNTPIASPVTLDHGTFAIVTDTKLNLERHAVFNREAHVTKTSNFPIILRSPAGLWDTRVHIRLSEWDHNLTLDPQLKEPIFRTVHQSRSRSEHTCILHNLNQSHRVSSEELTGIFADDLLVAGTHPTNMFLRCERQLRCSHHKETIFEMARSQALGEINPLALLLI